MFGTAISMNLVIQYGLQAVSGLLIFRIEALRAKSAPTKPWGKLRWSHRFDSF